MIDGFHELIVDYYDCLYLKKKKVAELVVELLDYEFAFGQSLSFLEKLYE